MKRAWLAWAAISISAMVLAGCAQPQPSPGEDIYRSYCAVCHGQNAQGNGPLAADLPVAPADLTGLAARNGGVFPSARVMEKIYGYPGRYQADVMPEFGPVLDGPTVLWTDETGVEIETPRALLDLRAYLETVQTQ